jgi:uncharacterized membrane protein YphA (DoxX/SURF4 family)
VLLRVAVGGTVAIQAGIYLADRNNPAFWTWMIGLAGLLSGISLLAGFLTPVAGALSGLVVMGIALSWLPPPSPNLFDSTLAAVLTMIVAAAVVFLGPGALSLDARLFGRREIIIPHTSRSVKF